MKFNKVALLGVLILLIIGFHAPQASASATINGAIKDIPFSEIEMVLIEPEISYPFIHHFMCIYIWNGKEWIIGTAGETKNPEKEIAICEEHFGENTVDPDHILNAKEYAEFEKRYATKLAKEGFGNTLCEAFGMITCPFTLGNGKPCYREMRIIHGILTEICVEDAKDLAD